MQVAKSSTQGFRLVCERPLGQLLDVLSSGALPGHGLPRHAAPPGLLGDVHWGHQAAHGRDNAILLPGFLITQ